MNRPTRIQLSRKKGWRLPPNTVVVSRPSRWGNPYKVGDEYNQIGAAFMFHVLMCGHFDEESEDHRNQQAVRAEIRKQLAGKNLACWCKLSEPCHADTLLMIANGWKGYKKNKKP